MTTPTTVTVAASSVATAAATAEKVVEAIAKVEGPILTGISIFVPGAAVVTVPLQTILPLIIPDPPRAENAINGASPFPAFGVGSGEQLGE